MPDNKEIHKRFVYHAPDEVTREIHDHWRETLKRLALKVNRIEGGETREKACALTALEEVAFWVHAHVARNLSNKGGA